MNDISELALAYAHAVLIIGQAPYLWDAHAHTRGTNTRTGGGEGRSFMTVRHEGISER